MIQLPLSNCQFTSFGGKEKPSAFETEGFSKRGNGSAFHITRSLLRFLIG